ncbi:MAG: glycosyltransferase family 2 protein [Methylotenera sp.]
MKSLDVSVVLAVKNEQVYIKSAISSVLSQTGLNYEVIVVDDGSVDQTFKILEQIAANEIKVRLFRNPSSGKCSAFNFGVAQAAGRFVCIFAGDDIMPEGSLSARFASVKELPDNIPTVGLCKIITMSDDKKFDGHLIPRALGRGALSGVSPLMNQLALNKIFPVPDVLPNEDTWMEIAILHFESWNIVHSDIVGCAWRCHSGNSINMRVNFPEYNDKVSIRMRAFQLFYDKYNAELSEISKRRLLGKVRCEKMRSAGDVIGVLSSPVRFVDKLRALSITNAWMYALRKQFYGIFSGW